MELNCQRRQRQRQDSILPLWGGMANNHIIAFIRQFAAQDRIMELELLNDQLRKGQGEAERKAKSQQVASNATKADVQRVSQTLEAMPKRFTQSLSSLRDEVDRLEGEKLSLELAKQRKTLKVELRDRLIQRRQSVDSSMSFSINFPLPHTGHLKNVRAEVLVHFNLFDIYR